MSQLSLTSAKVLLGHYKAQETPVPEHVQRYIRTVNSLPIEEGGRLHFESTCLDRFFSDDYEVDKSIISTLDKDTVIEAYFIPELVQIYRSQNFYEFGSYQIKTMLTAPFHELFERSSEDNDHLFKDIQRAMATDSMLSCQAPEHILKEIAYGHNKSYKMRTLKIVSFKYLGERKGFIITYKAKELDH